jgi:DNA polymerase-1
MYRENAKLAKLNYSNKRTITGRIVCKDKYNPQNLEKATRDRANIISRFKGGSIVVFDFVSFETRIALYMCQDQQFLNEYYNKDLHNETAKLIFETDTPTDEQRDLSKTINHALLYGAGNKTLLNKLSMFENPEKKLYDIRYFLSPLIETARSMAEANKNYGYIINKWGSIIRAEKEYAAFNNYIQSTAVEIIVDKLFEIRNFIHSYKSEFMFQVHDSLVFDIHPDDRSLIGRVKELLTHNQGMYFNIDVSEGSNYKDLKKINVEQPQY